MKIPKKLKIDKLKIGEKAASPTFNIDPYSNLKTTCWEIGSIRHLLM
jgi:hypothetical protein